MDHYVALLNVGNLGNNVVIRSTDRVTDYGIMYIIDKIRSLSSITDDERHTIYLASTNVIYMSDDEIARHVIINDHVAAFYLYQLFNNKYVYPISYRPIVNIQCLDKVALSKVQISIMRSKGSYLCTTDTPKHNYLYVPVTYDDDNYYLEKNSDYVIETDIMRTIYYPNSLFAYVDILGMYLDKVHGVTYSNNISYLNTNVESVKDEVAYINDVLNRYDLPHDTELLQDNKYITLSLTNLHKVLSFKEEIGLDTIIVPFKERTLDYVVFTNHNPLTITVEE